MFTAMAILTMETVVASNHGVHVDRGGQRGLRPWWRLHGSAPQEEKHPQHIFCPSVSLKTEERQIQAAKLTMTVMVKMITISDHDKVRFPNPLAD